MFRCFFFMFWASPCLLKVYQHVPQKCYIVWGESKGCLIKGCLNSTKIPEVGIPKAGIPKVGKTNTGTLPKTEIPKQGIPKNSDSEKQWFRKRGFRSWGFRKRSRPPLIQTPLRLPLNSLMWQHVSQNHVVLVLWGIAQFSCDMLQNGVSHRCACVKLGAKGGIAPLWGGASFPEKVSCDMGYRCRPASPRVA